MARDRMVNRHWHGMYAYGGDLAKRCTMRHLKLGAPAAPVPASGVRHAYRGEHARVVGQRIDQTAEHVLVAQATSTGARCAASADRRNGSVSSAVTRGADSGRRAGAGARPR